MARRISPELRDALETRHDLCVEIPAKHPGCRAWVNVGVSMEGDAISGFGVLHFEYPIEMMEREYDASADELPLFDSRGFRTEDEVNRYLDQILPPDANLIRVADDDDYPM
ncbi:MAG: hypothetical protein RMA76_43995 [Deltaproteobacteria bacterium]